MIPAAELWRGRRVLVTGATGIIGSWLVAELLGQRADVIALVRDPDPQSELYRSGNVQRVSIASGSIEDFDTLQRIIADFGADTVFHLAAQTIVTTAQRMPRQALEANIRGTYNVLEACRLNRDLVTSVVIASSDKAYGEQAQLPYVETMPLNGRHPYEVSKACADLIAQSYFHAYDLPVGIARCGNVFGGGDLNWTRLVPDTVRSFLTGRPLVIRSDGTYVRDYIYVKDVVHAYLCLGARVAEPGVRGEAFNFSREQPLTVLELVNTIRRLMNAGERSPEIADVASGEIRNQFLNAAKARNVLGWTPRYELDDALRETIDWYRTFLAAQIVIGSL